MTASIDRAIGSHCDYTVQDFSRQPLLVTIFVNKESREETLKRFLVMLLPSASERRLSNENGSADVESHEDPQAPPTRMERLLRKQLKDLKEEQEELKSSSSGRRMVCTTNAGLFINLGQYYGMNSNELVPDYLPRPSRWKSTTSFGRKIF